MEIITACLPVDFLYTNYKGESRLRTAYPRKIWFGSTEYHPEPQWFMQALDQEKELYRDFALKDMQMIDKTETSVVGKYTCSCCK
ncbi:hypothetical protein PQC38_gp047 [Aeromonas phage BUCT695]|uniref:hypothetical protein n=1 Tax=Aeromonas phage BUCT695 TaxID=2908630 RepID=UPI0023296B34|nr:hypothetical protein PQC38_gp047 [Aeromonas phage BUCT695]UIW10523.1 hypothetical protein [Aeromonas phage BUCT695]